MVASLKASRGGKPRNLISSTVGCNSGQFKESSDTVDETMTYSSQYWYVIIHKTRLPATDNNHQLIAQQEADLGMGRGFVLWGCPKSLDTDEATINDICIRSNSRAKSPDGARFASSVARGK